MTDAGAGSSEGATEGAAVAPPPLPEPSSSKQGKAGSDSKPAASSSSSSSTTKEETKKKGGKGKGKAKKGGAASGGAGAGAGAGSTSAFEQPWVEKYRPILVGCTGGRQACEHSCVVDDDVFCLLVAFVAHQLSDVVGNKEIIERLRVIAEDGNMPNIIIAVRVSHVCRALSPAWLTPPLLSLLLHSRAHRARARPLALFAWHASCWALHSRVQSWS